jgi:DNA-directed RNA polymerase specialized sigma24 family protein
MRFFGGMTAEEAGAALGVSDRTVKSDWRRARAFLESRLQSAGIGR